MAEEAVAQIFAAAAMARRNGDRAEELRLLESILEQSPENPQALNALGMAALATPDPARAAALFARAAAQDPGESALWMNLATAERALGNDEGEREGLNRALAADQLNFMAHLRLAELQQRKGEVAAAARSWQNVLMMAAGIDPMPPALAETLDDARRFVAGQMTDFASFIDSGMAEGLDTLPATDRRRMRATLDHMLGRRQIYRNECSGLHVPFLPADEFFDRAHFPWLAQIEARCDAIRREFLALFEGKGADAIRPYVRQESGTPDNKWSPLDGSLDWGACFLWEYGVRNDAVCALCPETAAALAMVPRNDIPGRAPTAFFSLLRPHTRIPPHTGVTNSRAIIHLPLIVPGQCGFRVGGETRAWQVGEAFAFDDTIEHEAWNDSDELRVVLIFDVWNPHLSAAEQQMLTQFFEIADRSGHNPGMK